MRDTIYTKEQAREKLMSGIKRASDAIAQTMGTSGSNAILEDIRTPGYMVSNDGASILERIYFADPIEELGKKILLESVGRANKSSGDGSSTATLLTSSILEEGMKHIGETSPMEIKKSLEACLPLIEESLKFQRKELVDKDGNIDFKLLEQCATISAEDESIGKMIREIYEKIGPTGIINWEASKTPFDHFETSTAIKIDEAKLANEYMGDMEGEYYTTQAIIKNPYILLAKEKITSETEVEKVFNELLANEVKELVIFCNEMDDPVLRSFTVARLPKSLRGVGFRFLVVKMPTVFNNLWWEDLSFATGGKIIDRASGIKMKEVGIPFLGRVEKITVTAQGAFLDGINDLTKIPSKDKDGKDYLYDHILALKVDGTDEALARAARLNTKTARYYVGGNSESSLAYRRMKVEDAVNSAWGAMQEGILPGGGVALLNVAEEFSARKNSKTIGHIILENALNEPFCQIIKNAGMEVKSFRGYDVLKNDYGYDTRTQKLVSMFDNGIVDSYNVVWGAVKSAIGVAAGILTCSTVVLLPRQEDNLIDSVAQKVQQAMTQR